tara:strand:+ start:16295 stop:17005 length:711 start_codon:yes stop_codon:yes gene_type:complete
MEISKQLKDGTKQSHSAAENTKFVASFLRGVLNPEEYRKLLANFYFVYSTMEEKIQDTTDSMVKQIRSESLERKDAIESDLEYYYGPQWKDQITPTDACNTYCFRINEVAEQDPYLLIAHHYTRYIGDLSGGQILKQIVQRVLKPPVGKGLNFYEFPFIQDAKEFKSNYRSVLDNLDLDQSEINNLIAEANYAFRLNMYMFDEIEGNASKSFWQLVNSYAQDFLREMIVAERFRNK